MAPQDIFMRSFRTLCATIFALGAFSCAGLFAEGYYVNTAGDDDNPGTYAQPWKTISHACLQLSPGDTLYVARQHFRNEGNIFVRFVDPVSYEYLPLEGTSDQRIVIRPYGAGGPPYIEGNFDIRGSWITLIGLTVAGDLSNTLPGIAVYESHNISIYSCRVFNHGGGGINFNHCDIVRAWQNIVYFNASLNPDQHSGISSFQPIVRCNSPKDVGVDFRLNRCALNENTVPPNGADRITDGNGIVIDDHRYTQPNEVVALAMMGMGQPGASSGTPLILQDAEGKPIGYSRRTVVYANRCYYNGGRGIHVFLSDNVRIYSNVVFHNLASPDLTDGLPRDPESNVPFFFSGEISCVDLDRYTRLRQSKLYCRSRDGSRFGTLFRIFTRQRIFT